MAMRRGKMLGVAMGDRTIFLAEVSVSGHGAKLLRAAEFSTPEGLALDDPGPLGRALLEFLRQQGFSARNAVVGVPARWLLSAERAFPRAAGAALAGMVRLDAERRFATDMDSLVCDYTDGAATDKGVRLLVTAVARKKAEQVLAMLQSARLKPRAMVPTCLALTSSVDLPCPSELALLLRPDHVEAVVRSSGYPSAIRHAPLPAPASTPKEGPASTAWAKALAAEALRLASLLPGTDSARVVIWNGVGLTSDDVLKAIGPPSGWRAELGPRLADLGIEPPDADPTAYERFAGAAALALTGARVGGLPVDFLHSKMATRKKSKNGRRVAWAAVLAVAALAAAAGLFAEWRRGERELAFLQERLAAMAPDIEAAQQVVDHVTQARLWTDRRPRFLEPLRDLTLAFPAEGSIWVTSLAIRGDMRIVISGKAADERSVLGLLDGIRRNASFDGAKLLYMRETTGSRRDVAFSMTFGFADKE